jgi:hypothetical protein
VESFGTKADSSTLTTALTGAVKSSAVAGALSTGAVCCTFAAGGSTAYSWAEYRDSFIIDAPGVAVGTVGRIFVNALITGSTSYDLAGNPASIGLKWRTTVFVNGQSANSSFFAVGTGAKPNELVVLENAQFGLQLLSFDVVFGTPIAVSLRAETGVDPTVGIATPSQAFGTSDLGSTLAWKGIQSLTVGGNSIAAFSAVSRDTGFDFRVGFQETAVPEPATWLMMIFGFGLIGAITRYHRPSALALT